MQVIKILLLHHWSMNLTRARKMVMPNYHATGEIKTVPMENALLFYEKVQLYIQLLSEIQVRLVSLLKCGDGLACYDIHSAILDKWKSREIEKSWQ